MYTLGTGNVWLRQRRKWPEIFDNQPQMLKPAGHAHALSMAERFKPKSILEVGHGDKSLLFAALSDDVECWGLDAEDIDKTVSMETLARLRTDFPNVHFENGYLGRPNPLPDDYFDMVFSVSVLEHIPHNELDKFYTDMYRILKPGGIHVHSYDVYFGQDVRPMFDSIERTGFEWVGDESDMHIYWTDWLPSKHFARPEQALNIILYERPEVVVDIFSHKIPETERSTHNWTTVFIAARKPVVEG